MPNNRDPHPSPKEPGWEEHNLSQLKYFRSLTLRQKLEAVEGMADVVRRFQQMRAEGGFTKASQKADATGPAAASTVRESAGEYRSNCSRPVLLKGCTPEPLGNYLKALGVFRLVAEQADPNARAWWENGHFVLFSRFDSKDELAEWFKKEYQPSPMPAPWSVNSGWWPPKNQPPPRGDKRGTPNKHLRDLGGSSENQLTKLKECLQEIFQIIAQTCTIPGCESNLSPEAKDLLGKLEKPAKKSDARTNLIAVLRNRMKSSAALRWIDAIGALARQRENTLFPFQLLADCGGEGVNSYVGNYYARLCEHLPVTIPSNQFWPGEMGQLSYRRLRTALFGEPSVQSRQADAAGGLYSPALVEAPNIGQTFVASPKKRTNPWDFILTMEGLVVWASAATRRSEVIRKEHPAFPFYCESAVGGSMTVGPLELSGQSEGKSRGEVWSPIWTRPSSFQEIDRLFVEGRITQGERPATRATQFALAVSSFGLERGIKSFYRTALLERGGSGDQTTTLAVSLGVMPARRAKGIDLAMEFGPFMDQVGELLQHHPNQPKRLVLARCQLEQAIFDFAAQPSNQTLDPRVSLNLLISVGNLQRELGITLGRVKYKIGQGLRSREVNPIHNLSNRWLFGDRKAEESSPTDDGSREYRLARAVAGIALWSEAVEAIRANLLPVIRQGNSWQWDKTSRSAVWARGVSLCGNLAAVLHRRLIDSTRGTGNGLPLWSGYGARFSDLLALLNREIDEERLTSLIHALALIDGGRWETERIDIWQSSHDPTPDLHSSAVWFDAADDPHVNIKPVIWRNQLLLSNEELRYAFELPRIYALLKLCFVGGRLPARPVEGKIVQRTGEEPYPPAALEVLNLLQAGGLSEAVEIAARKLRAKGYPPIFDPRKISALEIKMNLEDCHRLAGILLIPVRHVGVMSALAIKPQQ